MLSDQELKQSLQQLCNGSGEARKKIIDYFEENKSVAVSILDAHKKLAFDHVLKVAQQSNNQYAQAFLGRCFYFGHGVKKDFAEALKWYQKSAEQNNAAAQNSIGWLYFSGEGVKQDYAEALKWYRKAAEQKYASALNSLGYMYSNGVGVKQDYVEALKCYRIAAEQNDASAQNSIGWMYHYGQGVKQDYVEAVKCYQIAAEQNDASAQNNLGNLYQNGQGVKQDSIEAVKWYRKAAEQNNAYGQNNLGWMYYNGLGVKQDYVEALKWYRKAAEQNHASALNSLGLIYQNGQGVKQDYVEALKWYQKAAEKNNANAQNNLGSMYENGLGVKQDHVEAVKWYRKAAEQNLASAQMNLASMYDYGKGVQQSDAEALKWYLKAAEQNHSTAQNNIGVMYKSGQGVKKDYIEAVKWYLKAAEQNNSYAQKNLAFMYKNGHGVQQDYLEAFKWYQKAAMQNSASKESDLQALLCDAAKNNELEWLQVLLRGGVKVDQAKDNTGLTPLFLAALNNHIEVVQALLKAGVAVDQQVILGFTPIFAPFFAGSDNNKILLVLSRAGANVNHTISLESPTSESESSNGTLVEAMQTFKKLGVMLPQAQRTISLLVLYIYKGDVESVKILLAYDANPEAKVLFGTALETAALFKQTAIVELLNQYSKNPVVVRKQWRQEVDTHTNELLAPVETKLKTLEEKLNKPIQTVKVVDNNLQRSSGSSKSAVTPTMVASPAVKPTATAKTTSTAHPVTNANVALPTAPKVTAAPTKPSFSNKIVDSVLKEVDGLSKEEMLAGLEEMSQEAKNSSTALYIAAQEGNVENLKIQIKAGGIVDQVKDDGTTPLYMASCFGHLGAVQLLVNHGANVDLAEKSMGATPLYTAAYMGQSGVVQVLIKAGANVDLAEAMNGRTPLSIATSLGKAKLEVMQLLLHGGAKVDLAMKDGTTPLYIAAQSGNLEGVKLLLAYGADVDFVTPSGTAMQAATQKKHIAVVNLLMQFSSGNRVDLQRQWRKEIDESTKKLLAEIAKAIQQTKQLGPSERSMRVAVSIPSNTLRELKILGQGGFGKVSYGMRGEYTEVAIKQLLDKTDADTTQLEEDLQREAEIMASLRHPRIVQFYGVCFEAPLRIVMEYMPKGSLYSLIHSNQAFQWPQRISISTDIGEGLYFLHQETPQILHTDLNSRNVLLDTNFRAKLTDFGLAQVKKTIQALEPQPMGGTLQWMAPELFSDQPVYSTASDVYAFGVVLWELASRKVPFGDVDKSRRHLIREWVASGSRDEIPAETPSQYSQLIQRCWKVRREERPELKQALSELKLMQTELNQTKPNSSSSTTSQPQNASKDSKIIPTPVKRGTNNLTSSSQAGFTSAISTANPPAAELTSAVSTTKSSIARPVSSNNPSSAHSASLSSFAVKNNFTSEKNAQPNANTTSSVSTFNESFEPQNNFASEVKVKGSAASAVSSSSSSVSSLGFASFRAKDNLTSEVRPMPPLPKQKR